MRKRRFKVYPNNDPFEGNKLMKEYTDIYLLSKYDRFDNSEFKNFDLLGAIVNAHRSSPYNPIDAIDVETLKIQVDEFLDYCAVLKRFRKFESLFNGSLRFVQASHPHQMVGMGANGTTPPPPEDDHFDVDGHKFYTLDEVEKVWKNRMFL